MRAIILEEGSKECMPWITAEITTGRFPFVWWFEISYWDDDDECWVHNLDPEKSLDFYIQKCEFKFDEAELVKRGWAMPEKKDD